MNKFLQGFLSETKQAYSTHISAVSKVTPMVGRLRSLARPSKSISSKAISIKGNQKLKSPV